MSGPGGADFEVVSQIISGQRESNIDEGVSECPLARAGIRRDFEKQWLIRYICEEQMDFIRENYAGIVTSFKTVFCASHV